MKEFPFMHRIFWDIDLSSIDIQTHKHFIIERVLVRGGMNDVKKLFALYSREEIVEAIKHSKDLDAVTHNFCSNYFNIPKEEMHAPSQYY